jgi:hypothetical protein
MRTVLLRPLVLLFSSSTAPPPRCPALHPRPLLARRYLARKDRRARLRGALQSSVTFKLADLDPKSRRAVFENLAHDFPTRLSYQRVADNKLTILVSGPREDGQEQVLTYSLTRKR